MTLPPSGHIVSLNDESPTRPIHDGDRGARRLRRRDRRERGIGLMMPLNFGDAPGGWLIAHMNGDQELTVFFYDSAAEAERATNEAPHFPDATAISRTGSLLYAFRAPPTPEQVDIAEHCLALPASS